MQWVMALLLRFPLCLVYLLYFTKKLPNKRNPVFSGRHASSCQIGRGREARRKQAVSTTHVAAGGQRFIAPVSHLHEAQVRPTADRTQNMPITHQAGPK